MIIEVLFSIINIIFFITLGYIFNKTKFIKESTVDDFKKIIINIAVPCVIFNIFSKLDTSIFYVYSIAMVLILNIIMLLLGYLIKKIFKINNKYFSIMLTTFEGTMGYAIVIALFGIENLDKIVIYDMGGAVYLFFIGISILDYHNKKGDVSIKDNILKLFLSPIIISILLGLLANLINNYIPFIDNEYYLYIVKIFETMGDIIFPLISIMLGYSIKIDFSTLKLSVLTIILRLTFYIPCGYILYDKMTKGVFDLPQIYKYGLIILLILPPSFLIPAYIERDDEDYNYVITTISLSILFTFISLVFILA